MTLHWPDNVDEILGGDQTVVLAYATPAKGVVLTPMTNMPVFDREQGTLTPVNTSVGTWKKLERIRKNPQVALAYHTRTHGFSERPEFVLVQGRARLLPPDPDYPASIAETWRRFAGPLPGRLGLWWLRVWRERVGIQIVPERIVVWPDLSCTGEPEVIGAPLPEAPPEPQRAPAKGTGPRIRHRRAARRAARLPNRLLGWIGTDGFPVVAPVDVAGAEEGGIALRARAGLVPDGGRRAGFVAHAFTRYGFGQRLRKHTGWLEAERDRLVYAPHTERGYFLPPAFPLFMFVAGLATRLEGRDPHINPA